MLDSLFKNQVQDENKNAEYLCLSHNPFADVISVGLDNGHIKLYDERTLQVSISPTFYEQHFGTKVF